jgi:thiopurine S-methyltransferase
MDHTFWAERWATGRIGFHRAAPNPHLVEYADQAFGPAPQAGAVLVPLCGKSVDLAWLAARFERVIGVEFIEQAARDFFAEAGVTPLRADTPRGPVYHHANIAIHVADIFAVTREALGPDVRAVYDRAALIALPPALRAAYAAHLLALTDPGTRFLVITLEYPQAVMAGPPFSVSDDEVAALYATTTATRLARFLDEPPPALAGTPVHSSVWTLTR